MALIEDGRKTRHILNSADNMRQCAMGIFHRPGSSLPSVVNVASSSPQQHVLLTQAFSSRQTYPFAPFNLKCLSASPAGSRESCFTCSVPGCRVRSVRTGSHCASASRAAEGLLFCAVSLCIGLRQHTLIHKQVRI